MLAAGCTVGPDFVPPAAPPAASLVVQQPAPIAGAAGAPQGDAQLVRVGADIPAEWWALFKSPALDILVKQALRNSPDLQAAQATLRVAMENVAAQVGGYYPSVSAGLSASRNKNAAELSPTLASPVLLFNLYQAQLGMSWSPDVWGLNRREVEAARAQADAQRYQLQQVYVALTSNLVAAAIQEASLREQIAVTQKMLATAQDILSLAGRQKALGAISGADVEVQKVLVAQIEQSLPPLEKQLAQQRDLLRALAGRLPADDIGQEFHLDELSLPGELPLSVPARLVEQRADIKFAEANMQAANAEIGVAIANRLPNITITANDGTVATAAGGLFAPGNGFWSIGAGLAQPIFDGGILLHRSRAARAAYEATEAQYRGTVIAAFQNVADALHALEADGGSLRTAMAAEQAAQKSYDIAARQLALGQIGRSGLLPVQQALLQARLTQSQIRATRLADTAALFQALGGGWWNRPSGDSAEVGRPERPLATP
jgi:NodT family efflux transporter outer membrane factor (OMF) lipoprotein